MPFWPLTILPRWNGHPLPSDQRFDGLNILVAGSSSTLGLEAAKKVAVAGAATVIVTARTEQRSRAIQQDVNDHLTSLSIKPLPKIIPLVLELSDPTSIHTFIKSLQSSIPHLDHAILNAGTNETTHSFSPNSPYEKTLFINSIAPTLLSLLLLPLLLASPNTTNPSPTLRPHLVFVSSGTAWLVNIPELPVAPSSTTPIADLSSTANFPPGFFGGQGQYSRSKLFVEYAMRHIAYLPILNSSANIQGESAEQALPKVIVTSVCPGFVATNLARNYTENSWLSSAAINVLMTLMRRPDVGANIHVSALGKGEEVRGEMWKDDVVLKGEKVKNVKGEAGRELGERVWRELRGICGELDGEKHGGEGIVEKVLGA